MNPRTRALIIVGAIIITMTLFFIYIFSSDQKAGLSNNINLQRKSHTQLINLMIAQTQKSYKSRLKSLVENRTDIVKNFATKDREMLLKNTLLVYKRLQQENPHFRALFFINDDNTYFLKVHQPELYGDNLDQPFSPLVKQSNSDKLMYAGFEIVKGRLFYRIVNPVIIDDKNIGAIGFSINVGYFFEQLPKLNSIESANMDIPNIHSAFVLPIQELEKTNSLEKSYKVVGEHALLVDNGSLFAKLPKTIEIGTSIQRVKIEDLHYVIFTSVEFKNFKGNIIARVLSLINIESYVADAKNSITKSIILSLIMLLIAFVILYFNFNILFVKISQLNKYLEQTNKKLENRVQKRTAKLKKEIIEKRKIEEELKGIFKTIPDPIVVYNNCGDPKYLNHAFTEIFGWELEDLKNNLLPFVPDNEKQLTYDKKLEIYNNLEQVSFESKRVSKMGNTLNVLISAAVIKDVEGMNNGVVVNLQDITQQKIREVQLRQSQKMEAIGTLAGGIAHDFNNILSGIFGYAQLAKMNLKNPEKAGVKIDLIVKGAQRASDLVHQILTISRQSEHVKKPILFDLVVKEAIQFLRATIPSTISIKASIESGAKILADPGQAHQVIMNLCTNAAQAMGNSGGTLSVNLKDISITDKNENLPCNEMSGSYVKLEVKDTGCGIDATVLEKIFDPYFTTKKVGKGTGLGLALVDSIVKKHGGFIKVSSIINDGSKFEVYWPVVEKEEPIDIDVETLQSTANTIEK